MSETQVVSKKRISIIPAISINKGKDLNNKQPNKKIRVAAYCRVSTELEEQKSSFETQVTYYTDYIENHDGWLLAGIYADDGITGTMIKKRKDFKKMIADCMSGKIDMLITKSVSRFARNTVDTLMTIKKLRAKGIAIYFEKENVNTLDSSGDFLTTVLAGLAEEESRSISENVKWGYRKQFQRGVVHTPANLLGYKKMNEKEFCIIEEEAEVVRKIYSLYLKGMGINEISKEIFLLGFRTRKGKKMSSNTVKGILKNEKYVGDFLTQKTYSESYITKKSIKNNGELEQYYIKDNHKGIVSREVYDRVQEEFKRRMLLSKSLSKNTQDLTGVRYSKKYPFSNLIYCKHCGKYYVRKTWIKYDKSKSIVWRCPTRLQKASACNESITLLERDLYACAEKVFSKFLSNINDVKVVLMDNVRETLESNDFNNNEIVLKKRYDGIEQQISKLLNTILNDPSLEDTLKDVLLNLKIEQSEISSKIKENEEKRMLYRNNQLRLTAINESILNLEIDEDTNIDEKISKLINGITVLDANSVRFEMFDGSIFIENIK